MANYVLDQQRGVEVRIYPRLGDAVAAYADYLHSQAVKEGIASALDLEDRGYVNALNHEAKVFFQTSKNGETDILDIHPGGTIITYKK